MMIVKNILLLICWVAGTRSDVPKEKYITILANYYRSPLYVVIPYGNSQSNTYLVITDYHLHDYYLRLKKDRSMDYKVFLTRVLKSELKFDTLLSNPHYYHLIENNLAINKEYHKFGIRYILNKYLIALDGEFRNKQLSQQTMQALIKIMFDNNYAAGFSDYSGFYEFKTLK
jgi:hypothetical protein